MGRNPFLLSVVVVVRNQAPALRRQLAALQDGLAALVPRHELIVVDNASSDATATTLQALTAADGLAHIHAFVLRAPVAAAAASWVGVERAAGDVVATLSLDSDVTEVMASMLRELGGGVDVVVAHAGASAAPPRGGRFRTAFTQLRARLRAAMAWRLRPPRATARHRLLRRRVVNDLARHPSPAAALRALPHGPAWATAQVITVAPAATREPRGIGTVLTGWVRARVRRGRGPLRLAAWACAMAAVGNLGHAGYVAVVAASGRAPEAGWVDLALPQAATFAVLSASLAAGAAYLAYARLPFLRRQKAAIRLSFASVRAVDGPARSDLWPPAHPPGEAEPLPPMPVSLQRGWPEAPDAAPH